MLSDFQTQRTPRNATNSAASASLSIASTNDFQHYNNDTTDATSVYKNESFWLETLDISSPIQCGANKCFFPQQNDTTQGWLLAPKNFRFEHRNSAHQVQDTLEASFELAHNLTTQYEVKHFLASPPIPIKLSKSLENFLNSNLYSEARRKKLSNKRFKKVALAQQVQRAPSSSLIFGCTASKRGLFFSQLPTFIAQVKDKEAFSWSFHNSMQALRNVLLQETCLFIDFHVMVGVDGTIYHLDFDRCFSTSNPPVKRKKKPSKSCLKFFDKVERTVQQKLDSENSH